MYSNSVYYVKAFEQIGVRIGVGTLLGRLPELLLGRVPVHGAYFDEAICTNCILIRPKPWRCNYRFAYL